LTKLSFACDSLDFILSFDVLEHVPDYKAALAECLRCLKPGGVMLSTAPFAQGSQQTIVRAKLLLSGEVEHLLEPEYHGDPTRPDEGGLCSYHFGWDLLDDFQALGAADVGVLYCYPGRNGYFDDEQVFFMAVR
jgi:SAM-dependent methyltransferase